MLIFDHMHDGDVLLIGGDTSAVGPILTTEIYHGMLYCENDKRLTHATPEEGSVSAILLLSLYHLVKAARWSSI